MFTHISLLPKSISNFTNQVNDIKHITILKIIKSFYLHQLENIVKEIAKGEHSLSSRTLFNTSYTRSEIYLLCALFVIVKNGKFPSSVLELNNFIENITKQNWDINNAKTYLEEFINTSYSTTTSWGGQKYNLVELRNEARNRALYLSQIKHSLEW